MFFRIMTTQAFASASEGQEIDFQGIIDTFDEDQSFIYERAQECHDKDIHIINFIVLNLIKDKKEKNVL